jgi:hypothetical protein
MRSSSKKVVAGLTLLSFLVGLTAGVLAEVPLAIVFGRAGLAAFAFAGVSTLVVSLTERA